MPPSRDHAIDDAADDRLDDDPEHDELLAAHAEAGFAELVGQLASELHSYAARTVGSDRAEDIVSDVFLVVWRRWDEMPIRHEERRAWLYGIVRRVILTAQRTERRRRRLLRRFASHHERPKDDDVGRALQEIEIVSAILQGVTAEQALALRLTALDGLSTREAAKELGISASALANRLSRARQTLRRYLANERRRDDHT